MFSGLINYLIGLPTVTEHTLHIDTTDFRTEFP